MLPLLRLAIPVSLSYLGLMTMGLVDLIAVGRVSSSAVGAIGIGNSLFSWFLIFGIGLLSGMDFPVAHSFGAGRKEDCHRYFWQGVYISLVAGLPLTLILCLASGHLERLGFHPDVVRQGAPYLKILAFSLPASYLFTTGRNYLQAMGVVRPTVWLLIASNILNALLNWVLVFGHWGFPRLEAEGSAIATLISRWLMALVLAGMGAAVAGLHRSRWSWERMRTVLKLGLPASGQMVLEVGVFALATALAGRLSPDELAAHQIVLNSASITFMVPLGIGAATAVLVGQSLGERDWPKARHTGWQGFFLGSGFMTLTGITMLLIPDRILGIYSNSAEVIALGKTVLFLAALFQVFDGAQVVLTGALRGCSDTRSSFLVNLFGHWAIGLPVGVFLCFGQGWGIRGLWTGLALGLTSVAVLLLVVWAIKKQPLLSSSSTGG